MGRVLKSLLMVGSVFLTLFGSHAQAFSFSVFEVQDTSQVSSDTSNYGTQSGIGGGAGLTVHLFERVSFEGDVLYFNRTWTDTSAGASVVSGGVLNYAGLFRGHLVNWFSFGVGGYYSSASGNLTVSGSNANSNLTYDAYGILKIDEGLVADLTAHLAITEGFRLRLSARYLYGLSNLLTPAALVAGPATTFQNRDLQVLAGLTFFLGAKNAGQTGGSRR